MLDYYAPEGEGEVKPEQNAEGGEDPGACGRVGVSLDVGDKL